jgi:hypothetical protein
MNYSINIYSAFDVYMVDSLKKGVTQLSTLINYRRHLNKMAPTRMDFTINIRIFSRKFSENNRIGYNQLSALLNYRRHLYKNGAFPLRILLTNSL